MEKPIVHRGARRTTDAMFCLAIALGFGSAGCMRETVRDSHGNLIYQETVHGSLSESDQDRSSRILETESEIGYY